MLVAFGVIEARVAKAPLIPFKELTQTLKNANTIVLLFSAALFPMWILSTLYLQQVLGLTALDTGLIFLPMTVAIGVVARSAGRLVSALGVREVLGSGLIMMTVGMLLLTRIAPSGSGIVYVMIPGILVAGGDRPVDRALHDRRHPGLQGGPGGAGLGAREHLATGRRRPRSGDPDHARHAAHVDT